MAMGRGRRAATSLGSAFRTSRGAKRATAGRVEKAYMANVQPPLREMWKTHPRTATNLNRVGSAVARHPVLAASGAFTASMAYGAIPGPQRSTRNQNDPYLRRVRAHQSSAIDGLVPRSMGGYA